MSKDHTVPKIEDAKATLQDAVLKRLLETLLGPDGAFILIKSTFGSKESFIVSNTDNAEDVLLEAAEAIRRAREIRNN